MDIIIFQSPSIQHLWVIVKNEDSYRGHRNHRDDQDQEGKAKEAPGTSKMYSTWEKHLEEIDCSHTELSKLNDPIFQQHFK